MYPAAVLLKEDTEAARPGPDCEAAVSCLAVLSPKGLRGDPQEFGDSLRFLVAKGNAALAIAAFPAPLAVECFHKRSPK